MMSNINIVRQKASYEKICDFKTTGSLYFPREDPSGSYYVVSQSGEVFYFNEGSSEQVFNVNNGQPSCICFDLLGGLYLSDVSNGCVYHKAQLNDNNTTIETILVKEFNEEPFRGPTSLAYDKEENILFIADGGSFLSSAVYPAHGSLFMIDLDSKIMKPMLINCLSFPSDIYYDPIKGNLFIAETFANRVTRMTQHPQGVFHSSVFYQFNGRLGPTALAMDEMGNLYVARYEFQQELDGEMDGLISVISPQGILIGELIIPKLAEITGLLIPSKKKENLYLTEKNSNGVIKIKLSSFVSELDKIEENIIKYN